MTRIGIDICKAWLDIADPALGMTERIANKPDPLAVFAASLAGCDVIIVFEATGAYHTDLRHALAIAGVADVRVNHSTPATRSAPGRRAGSPKPTRSTPPC